MDQRIKVISFSVGVIILGLFSYLIYNNSIYSSKIDFLIAPSVSTVKLDGKKINPTKTYNIKPGKHMVTVSYDGFTGETIDMQFNKGEKKTALTALVSNSSATKNWYLNHPDDQKIAEGVSSRQFTQASQQQVAQNPIIKLLPWTGPNFEYRIDYGNLPDVKGVVLTITAPDEKSKTDALNWIKSQGYDPASFTIKYITESP